MNKLLTIVCTIFYCLVLGQYSTNSTVDEYLEDYQKSLIAEGDLPINGTFSIEIYNLSQNQSGEWYDLQTSTPVGTELTIQIIFSATNLDLENRYNLKLELWSTNQNHSLIKHNSENNLFRFNTTADAGNNDTHSSTHGFVMIEHPDVGQFNSRIHGCYWIEYSVEPLEVNSIYHPSGISDRVSFGEVCPHDDSDFDGWSDEQENVFGSDPTNPSSTPYSLFNSQLTEYYLLLEMYNQSQIIDTDGDSWSNEQEEAFGSLTNDSDSTPLTILIEMSNMLSATNNSLEACQTGWDITNLSLSHCQSDYDILNSSYNNCIEGWEQTNSSLESCIEESSHNSGLTDCSNQSGCPNYDRDLDGWLDDIESLCGSNSSSNESQPTFLAGAICWELADSDLDGVRNMDDVCPNTNSDSDSAVNSTGCKVECIKCNQDQNENSAETSNDEIDITGGGDVVDLIVVGGSSLLAGIGATSFLRMPKKWKFKKPKIDDSTKKKIKDVVEDLDIDLDLDSDDKTKNPKPKRELSKTSPSDQYFKTGVERQKAMTSSADPLLDDYVED
jgi:hypothetical protein